MEFRDLKRQYQVLKPEIDTAVEKVMTNGNFINGEQVQELEKQLAEYVGVKHCVTCANGTDALTLAMMAWQLGKGDAVFVPDFTFFSSGEIVSFAGATPVFVDTDVDTYNLSVESLEYQIKKVISDGKLIPKAIVAVDLFGQPADYCEIKKIAEKYDLYILEDAAQGFGGEIQGRRTCSFGDIATTSFFPAKPLGCYGDGGAVFTNDDYIADLIKSLRVHGKGTMKYDNVRVGVNSRLDTLQAAILHVKLQAFEKYELDAVNQVATLYSEELQGVVKQPIVKQGFYSSWAQYTIQLKDEEERNKVKNALSENGIPSMIYYPKPMHKQLAFENEDYEYVDDDYKNTNFLCKRVLALPMHPYMNDVDVKKVAEVIKLTVE